MRLVSHKAPADTLSWSRDGKRLALDGRHGLSVVDLESGRVRQLTHEEGDSEQQWLPTGTTIAFLRTRTVNRNNYGAIYVIRADGTGLRRVTRPSTNVQGFDLSPDGRSLAFVSRTGTPSVCDGTSRGDVPPVWPLSILDLATGRSRRISPDSGAYLSPQWSPDGALIAVRGWTCETRRHLFPWILYVLGSRGENLRHVPSGDYFAWVPPGS